MSNVLRSAEKYSSSCLAVVFRIGWSGLRWGRPLTPVPFRDDFGQTTARSPRSEATSVRVPTGVGWVVEWSIGLLCIIELLLGSALDQRASPTTGGSHKFATGATPPNVRGWLSSRPGRAGRPPV